MFVVYTTQRTSSHTTTFLQTPWQATFQQQSQYPGMPGMEMAGNQQDTFGAGPLQGMGAHMNGALAPHMQMAMHLSLVPGFNSSIFNRNKNVWTGDAPDLPDVNLVFSVRDVPSDKDEQGSDRPVYSLALLAPGDKVPHLRTEKMRGESCHLEFERTFVIPGNLLTEQAFKGASITLQLRKEVRVSHGPDRGTYQKQIAEARISFRHIMQDALAADRVNSRVGHACPSFHAFRSLSDAKYDKRLAARDCFLQVEATFAKRLDAEVPKWQQYKQAEKREKERSDWEMRREIAVEKGEDPDAVEVQQPEGYVSRRLRALKPSDKFAEEIRLRDEEASWNMREAERQRELNDIKREKKEERKAIRDEKRAEAKEHAAEDEGERRFRLEHERQWMEGKLQDASAKRETERHDRSMHRERDRMDRSNERDKQKNRREFDRRGQDRSRAVDDIKSKRELGKLEAEMRRKVQGESAKDRERRIADLHTRASGMGERFAGGRDDDGDSSGYSHMNKQERDDYVRRQKEAVHNNDDYVSHFKHDTQKLLGKDEYFDATGVVWKRNQQYQGMVGSSVKYADLRAGLESAVRGDSGSRGRSGRGGGAGGEDDGVSDGHRQNETPADFYGSMKETRAEVARLTRLIARVEAQSRKYPDALARMTDTLANIVVDAPTLRSPLRAIRPSFEVGMVTIDAETKRAQAAHEAAQNPGASYPGRFTDGVQETADAIRGHALSGRGGSDGGSGTTSAASSLPVTVITSDTLGSGVSSGSSGGSESAIEKLYTSQEKIEYNRNDAKQVEQQQYTERM
jgi:hypothetical protein